MTDNIKLPKHSKHDFGYEFDSGIAPQVEEYAEAYAREAVRLNAQAVPDARELFNAGWCAAARFCDREDVVYDGLVGPGGCPAFEVAYRAALSAAPAAPQPAQQGLAQEKAHVVNSKVTGTLAVGDYVFASRWSDCDPGDPWFVGHIAEIHLASPEHAVPYPGYVVLAEAPNRRWPHAMRITPEQGARIIAEFPRMEHGPRDFSAIARVFGA